MVVADFLFGYVVSFNAWSAYYPDFNGRSIVVTVLCNTSVGGHPFYLVKDILKVKQKPGGFAMH